MNKKFEVAEKTDTSENLSSLVELVNSSVSHYEMQAPKLRKLDEILLEELSSPAMLEVMDIDTKMKLLGMVQKSMITPIESLTKLVQSMTSLKERMELSTSKQELENLIDEIREAKDSNKAHNLDSLEVK